MEIYWDGNEQLTAGQLDLLTRAIKTVIEYESTDDATEISVSFMSADEIQALNRDYRGKDAATDVLSFPVDDTLAVGPGRPLGDIVICMDIARRQAEEYEHSLERELAFLLVHGMLHLLGYDHETPEDETKMCAAQDEILGLMNLHRH